MRLVDGLPMTARARLTGMAARQGGWIAREQLRDVGVDSSLLGKLQRGGFLRRDGAAYQVSALPTSPQSTLWRAVLITGGVLSHTSAAALLRSEPPSSVTHVTISRRENKTVPNGVVVHRSRRLPPAHLTRQNDGLPHTIAPRTFVDLAAPGQDLPDSQLVDYLDSWVAQGEMTMRWLAWFLESESQWLPGRRRAIDLLRSLAGSEVDSRAERQLARLLRAHVLNPFVTQHAIRLDDRLVARVDFAWPPERVALELDSYRFHSGPTVFANDRSRGNEIELAGWLLLRTTPREVRDAPDQLVRTVRRALDLRAA